ncbi:hypothetical protein ACF0H5_003509 [Mactra antiquata]
MEAWSTITPSVTRKSFKKCGSSSALDGYEDHLFGQESDDKGSNFEGFTAADLEEAQNVLENIEIMDESSV